MVCDYIIYINVYGSIILSACVTDEKYWTYIIITYVMREFFKLWGVVCLWYSESWNDLSISHFLNSIMHCCSKYQPNGGSHHDLCEGGLSIILWINKIEVRVSIHFARLLISIKEPNTIISFIHACVHTCMHGSFLRTSVHVGEKCKKESMHAPPEL